MPLFMSSHSFELSESLANLQEMFHELCYTVTSGKYDSCRMLVDFGGLVNKRNFTYFKAFEETVLWKCSSKGTSKNKPGILSHKKFPLTAITAITLGSLDSESLSEVVNMHKNMLILTETGSMALTGHPISSTDKTSISAVPQPALEEIVKNNLEIVVLNILAEKPLCGYDVIKCILQRYHTSLSQGTVYPLLYSLENRNLLKTESQGKSKVYSPTEEGKELTQKKLDDFIKAQEYMLGSLRRSMPPIEKLFRKRVKKKRFQITPSQQALS